MRVAFGFLKKLRIFQRHRRGSAGIEFALVAPIFFGLLMGIIETGVLFYANNTLQFATYTAGRLVRTGAAQGTDFATAARCAGSSGTGAYANSQQWFKDQICCGISNLLTDCTQLHVNVQNYSGGFGTDFSNTTDANGHLQPVADGYSPGNPCDVVLLRATYNWTVVTPGLSWFLVNMANNQHLLSATATFRNEPYTAASGGC